MRCRPPHVGRQQSNHLGFCSSGLGATFGLQKRLRHMFSASRGRHRFRCSSSLDLLAPDPPGDPLMWSGCVCALDKSQSGGHVTSDLTGNHPDLARIKVII